MIRDSGQRFNFKSRIISSAKTLWLYYLLLIWMLSFVQVGVNGATITGTKVEVSPTTINSNSTLSLLGTTQTAVPANGRIVLTLPSVMSVSTSTTLTCTFIEPSALGTVTWGYVGNVITATLGSTALSAGFFQMNIAKVVNPPSATVTSSFTFQTQNSAGTVLDQQTTSITLTATAGSLAAVTLSTSSTKVGQSNTLTVSFTTSNKVIAGGKVSITIPKWNSNAIVSTEIISMLGSSYSINVISNLQQASLSASFISDVLTLSGGIPSNIAANSVISFNITNFLNPISTSTVSGFTVTTLDSSSGSIDSGTATLRVTTAADVYGTSITSKDTTIVQELAELRIQFKVPVPLNQGCIIDVTFPSDFVLTGTDLTNVQGFGLFGGSRSLTGSVNVGNNTYTITDGCSTYVSQDQLAIMDFSSVENPFTIKTTGSISIYI